MVGVVILGLLLTDPILQSNSRLSDWWVFAGAAVGIAAIGWLDDLHDLSQWFRMAVYALAAFIVLLALGPVTTISLPVLGPVLLDWVAWPLLLLWLVGLTNAYNFMDGIDGIAGCQGVVAGLGWAVLGLCREWWAVEAFGLLLAGASLGFLTRNWPPARVFMGDVGSTFLGFSFAALPLLVDPADPRLFLAGLLFVWPFVFDTTFTLIRRLLRGENILRAHRSHLYQRLVIAGCSHRFVTLLYTGLAAAGGVLAIGYASRWPGADWLAVLAPPVMFAGFWILVGVQERKAAAANMLNSLNS